MRRALAAALLVLAAASAGCSTKKKKDDGGGSASGRAPTMTPAEIKRGEDACTGYVKQLCACAAARPDDAALKERCELKQAKPEALQLLYDVDADPSSSDDSRLRAQIEARKLIAKCIQEAAQLPAMGCR